MAGLALAIVGLLAPAPAAADWTSNTCTSCHGTPPDIASSVPNAGGACGGANFTLGLGETFMDSQAQFTSHVNTRGTACSVGAMSGLSGADATSVYTYLLNVRNGFIGSFSPSWVDTEVGSSRDDSVSFTGPQLSRRRDGLLRLRVRRLLDLPGRAPRGRCR